MSISKPQLLLVVAVAVLLIVKDSKHYRLQVHIADDRTMKEVRIVD